MSRDHPPLGRLLAVVCASLLQAARSQAADPVIDSVMYRDPVLPEATVVYSFPKQLLPLWLQALARPEVDLQCQAALAIAEAHHRGMKDLGPAIAPLVHALEKPGQHPTVLLASARALVELDARSAAPGLFQRAQSEDPDLRDLIEPALARWDYAPIRVIWRQRLNQPGVAPRLLVLAMRGLALLHDATAADSLRGFVMSTDTPPSLRLEAARALGHIRTSGAEDDVRLLRSGDRVARLAALLLLHRHQGRDAVALLQGFLHDSDSPITTAAVTRLMQIDPKLVLPALQPLLENRDAGVRHLAVEALVHEITSVRLPLLAARCDDVHPAIRVQARRSLRVLADRPDFRNQIVKEAMSLLAGPSWRGQEQAAILLGQLGHRAAAPRLLELLYSHRAEVCLAAAWSLRQLAVLSTLPGVVKYIATGCGDVISHGPRPAPRQSVGLVVDEQLSQLNQLLGKMRYHQADRMLRTFIARGGTRGATGAPKSASSRTAAIWALGLLHEGKPDKPLIDALETLLRLSMTPAGADDPGVLRMCCIGLARMKSTSSVGLLRQFYRERKPSLDMVNNAAGWALEQLTGQPVPHSAVIERSIGGWFLR